MSLGWPSDTKSPDLQHLRRPSWKRTTRCEREKGLRNETVPGQVDQEARPVDAEGTATYNPEHEWGWTVTGHNLKHVTEPIHAGA